MHLILRIFVYLFTCVILSCFISCFIGIFENEKLSTLSMENTGDSAELPISSFQQIPQEGDVICCEDGSTYTIMDVSQYHQVPAEPGFEALFVDTLSDLAPKADAIHFTDISSDYLFVKNRYEMYRMLYTLNQSLELDDVNIQLSIPEDAIPIVLDSWDTDQVTEFRSSHPNRTCCLESWDFYKNGAYLKTVYLAAAV